MLQKPIVSGNIRLRYPEHFVVGEGSIVDDFCYFSTRVVIGRYSHIAPNCSIIGGIERTYELGDFSSLSTGARVLCTSNDFTRDVVSMVPGHLLDCAQNAISGDVIFERITGLGANSVVMPNNHIPEGTVIGALSFVPPAFEFKSWTVYAGVPIRAIRPRDREAVMRQVDAIERKLAARREEGGAW